MGRTAELERIRAFLAGAARVGGTYLLTGEPGVGKTVLLDAAVEIAAEAGAKILRAAGVQFEADVSYSSLNQLLVPLAPAYADLQPEYRQALTVALGMSDGPPPARLTLINATLALLQQACPDRLVLLAIDDLPWLDRASAVLLSSVARRLSGSRVGLIGTSRTGGDSFFERGGLPEAELGPLSNSAAVDLLKGRFPSLAPGVLKRLLHESQGNPLALLELSSGLTGAQRAARSALPTVMILSDRLQAVFADRLAGLPDATKALLLRAVLEGSGDLQLLSSLDPLMVGFDDLIPAQRAHLIRLDTTAAHLTFRHPLLRSAIIEDSTPEQRRQAHRELAEALDEDPDRRAWHLAEASSGSDEVVASQLEQAAQRTLQRGDSTGAVQALVRAAHLSPTRSDRSRRLAQAAYLGVGTTGELLGAAQMLEQARRLDPERNTSLHAAAAAAYILLNADGDVITAYRLLVGAIESGSHGYDAADEGLIEALHTLLLVCFWAGRVELWDPFYRALDRLKPETPELLYLLSRMFPDPARVSAPLRVRLAALIDRLSAENEPMRIMRVNTAAAYVDLLGETRESAWRLVRDGRMGGAVRSSIGGLMYLALDDFFTGRWAEAQQLADEGLALCTAHGYGFVTWFFLYHQALLAAVRGQDQAAHEWADELTRVTELRKARGAAEWAHHPRSLAALGQGDFEGAYRHASALSPAGVLAPFVPHALWVVMDLVEAAVCTGRYQEADAHVAAMHKADLAGISPRLALLVAASTAIADQGESSPARFEEALKTPDAYHWPFDQARIQLLYGERLRRLRLNTEARAQLNAALATFQRLGAVPWAERARSELRAAGQGQKRASKKVTVTVLTAQERNIAELAAEGLTNRQIAERLFLSHRTVGAHLYRLYPKLGISTRGALRDALAALERLP
ncbi:ATP-binding protein [Actinacidiphila rubida]|uniref:ATP-binding protein n=1 Tax=Actinacidiphila rubida TaxID=310780 RepID=UPI000AC446C5|nr:LuxR family transcriptional regulator [Actinacidiphila rubida]